MEIIFNHSKLSDQEKKRLKKLANYISKKKLVAEVSFVNEKKMKELNKKYRSKNKPTDVLSFNMNEKSMLGDIIICPSVARKNAKLYGVSYMDEVSRLFVHGLLHLFGFDHGIKMFNKQEKILLKGGFTHA